MHTLDVDVSYHAIAMQDELGCIQPANSRKIPCQVCGAMSSGLHFGVFTCEGCKCFYRRSIREGANYACAKERSCDITMETRNSCRFCRFQKCIGLGMSKEGIKLGRRPKVENEPLQHMCFTNRSDAGSIPIVAGSPRSLSWSPTYNGHGTDHVITHPNYMKSPKNNMDVDVYSIVGHSDGVYNLKHEGISQCDHCNEPFTNQYAGVSENVTGYQSVEHAMHPTQNFRWKVESTYGPTSCVQNNYPSMNYSANPNLPPTMSQSYAWHASEESSSSVSELSSDEQGDNGLAAHSGSKVTLTIPEVQAGAVAALAYANLYRDKTVDQEHNNLADNKTGDVWSVDAGQSKSYTELVVRKTVSPVLAGNDNQNKQYGPRTALQEHVLSPTCNNERQNHSAMHTSLSDRKRSIGPGTVVISSYMKRRKHWSEDEPTTSEQDGDEESYDEETGEMQHEKIPLSTEFIERLIEAFVNVTKDMQRLWKHHLHNTSLFKDKSCNKDLEIFVREWRADIHQIITEYSYNVYGNLPISSFSERAYHVISRLCLFHDQRHQDNHDKQDEVIVDGHQARATQKAAVICALSLLPSGSAISHQLTSQQKCWYTALLNSLKGHHHDTTVGHPS